MKPLRVSFLLVSLAGLFLALPGAAFADFEEVAIPRPDTIVLSLKAVKPGTLQSFPTVVAKDSDVEIRWQSDAKNGCYGNFKSGKLDASGSATGKLTKTQPFAITCYGNGSVQSAKVQLTVGSPIIGIASAGIGREGLQQKFDSKGRPLPFTYIGGGEVVMQGVVKNAGKLDLAGTVSTQFEYSSGGSWSVILGSTASVQGLTAGKSQVVTYRHRTGTEDAVPLQFRFCVNKGKQNTTVDESCRVMSGKFKFTAP